MDQAQRPPAEIVRDINQALERAGQPGRIVSARRLPSGDLIRTADASDSKPVIERASIDGAMLSEKTPP